MTNTITTTKLRVASWTFAWALFGTLLTGNARAECPGSGEAQLNWKNAPTALPANTGEFLTLIQDSCTTDNPPATYVTAKLVLENQTDTTQTAECWLSTTKSSDYVLVTLASKGRSAVMLQIANVSGGDANANRASLMCRNAAASANTVNATWLKVITKVVRNVMTFEAP